MQSDKGAFQKFVFKFWFLEADRQDRSNFALSNCDFDHPTNNLFEVFNFLFLHYSNYVASMSVCNLNLCRQFVISFSVSTLYVIATRGLAKIILVS